MSDIEKADSPMTPTPIVQADRIVGGPVTTKAAKYAMQHQQLQRIIDEASATMLARPSLSIASDIAATVGTDGSLVIKDESDGSVILLDHDQAVMLASFLRQNYSEETP